MEQLHEHPNYWHNTHRIAFRFISVFFFLYIFPFPLTQIPGIHVLTQWYTRAWQAVIVWVGDRVLHLPEPITVFRSGSGDKTYDFVFLLVVTVFSALAATVWSVVDRHRTAYPTTRHWLLVMVRYYLGMMMVVYGTSKVFHLQMPSPMLIQLVQPFGDKSPMGLAWSYVGYSKAFSAFTGLAEVIGGVLLFFRRTTTLGALIVAAVMLNVVVMNFTFDIPVKLYSSLLFLMAVFLLLPDAGRLMRVLLWNKPTQPRPYRRYLHKRWMRIMALVVKVLFIGSVLIGNVMSSYSGMKTYGDKRARSPVYGIYDTERFVLAGDTLPPLITDNRRWRQVIMQSPQYLHVKLMNDSMLYFPVKWDTTARQITLNPEAANNVDKAFLRYEVLPESLRLHGVIKYDSVDIRLRERDLHSFRLINSDFRWIQEYPYNR